MSEMLDKGFAEPLHLEALAHLDRKPLDPFARGDFFDVAVVQI
jgi:hypothetical protein